MAKRLLYANLGTEVKEEWSVKDPSQHATTFPWHTRELLGMSPRAAANLDIELGHDENLDSAAAAQDRQVCEKLPSLGICYSGEGTYLHL